MTNGDSSEASLLENLISKIQFPPFPRPARIALQKCEFPLEAAFSSRQQ
jgi:hypothetical protein